LAEEQRRVAWFTKPFEQIVARESAARRSLMLQAKAEVGPARVACRKAEVEIHRRTCTEPTRLQALLAEYEALFPTPRLEEVDRYDVSEDPNTELRIPLELSLQSKKQHTDQQRLQQAELINDEQHFRAVTYVDWGRELGSLKEAEQGAVQPMLMEHRRREEAAALQRAIAGLELRETESRFTMERRSVWALVDSLKMAEELKEAELFEGLELQRFLDLEVTARSVVERLQCDARRVDILGAFLETIVAGTPALVTRGTRRADEEARMEALDVVRRNDPDSLDAQQRMRAYMARKPASDADHDRWLVEAEAERLRTELFHEAMARSAEMRNAVFPPVDGQSSGVP
jgi:hypothetical protein